MQSNTPQKEHVHTVECATVCVEKQGGLQSGLSAGSSGSTFVAGQQTQQQQSGLLGSRIVKEELGVPRFERLEGAAPAPIVQERENLKEKIVLKEEVYPGQTRLHKETIPGATIVEAERVPGQVHSFGQTSLLSGGANVRDVPAGEPILGLEGQKPISSRIVQEILPEHEKVKTTVIPPRDITIKETLPERKVLREEVVPVGATIQQPILQQQTIQQPVLQQTPLIGGNTSTIAVGTYGVSDVAGIQDRDLLNKDKDKLNDKDKSGKLTGDKHKTHLPGTSATGTTGKHRI